MSSPLFAGSVVPSRYRESPPSELVAGVVACRWAGSGGWDRRIRLMPDGCADLVWDGTSVLVVGARAGVGRFPVPAEAFNVGLRVRPGVAGALAGCRASDLPPDPVPLADLWGAGPARHVSSALAAAMAAATEAPASQHQRYAPTSPPRTAAHADHPLAVDRPGPPYVAAHVETAAVHRVLERAVGERLEGCGGGRRVDPAVVEAGRLLARPWATVDGVAAAVGLSGRELRRRFHDHVGYGPKALHRVLRFRRFLTSAPDLVAGRTSLASAAAEAGYADQSHLGRDCRRLSGSSPAALLARWADAARSGRNVPDPAWARPPG